VTLKVIRGALQQALSGGERLGVAVGVQVSPGDGFLDRQVQDRAFGGDGLEVVENAVWIALLSNEQLTLQRDGIRFSVELFANRKVTIRLIIRFAAAGGLGCEQMDRGTIVPYAEALIEMLLSRIEVVMVERLLGGQEVLPGPVMPAGDDASPGEEDDRGKNQDGTAGALSDRLKQSGKTL
jgi:hypothetical protein